MIASISFHADPGRTVIIGTKRALVDMIQQTGDKGFMVFWHALLVGWIVCWQEGVEKTIEFACAYETDVAYLHWPVRVPWVRLPQCVSERRILDCKLFAKDVVVGHLGPQGSKNDRAGWGWSRGRDTAYRRLERLKHGPTCEAH
jgi:hypothetical protein